MTNDFYPEIKQIHRSFGRCSVVSVDARPFQSEFGFVVSLNLFRVIMLSVIIYEFSI